MGHYAKTHVGFKTVKQAFFGLTEYQNSDYLMVTAAEPSCIGDTTVTVHMRLVLKDKIVFCAKDGYSVARHNIYI